ncbi:CWF16 [Sanghuangporus vaninii]
MSERKVLNKYIPPDFDPSLIPRRKVPRNSQQVVRLMAPFSMRCNTCGEYIYKGKKFNARKETVEGETYYGIKIFRFYIKCTLCSAEITFKTDPKNTDYAAEHGASRNFEPWRDEAAAEEEDKLARLEAEENNPMKALENRTLDSKREMDVLDALQDIRARNARNERVAASSDLLDKLALDEVEQEEAAAKRLEDEEDEKLVREVFSRVGPSGPALKTEPEEESPKPSTSSVVVKRKADGDEPELHKLLSDNAKSLLASKNAAPAVKKQKTASNAFGIKLIKKGKAPVKAAS